MSEGASQNLKVEQPLSADAANRSRLYALFAEALAYPEQDSAFRLLNGDWWGELRDTLGQLEHVDLESLAEQLSNDFKTVNDLQTGYSALFDVASGTPQLSMLERRYVKTPEQKLWERLLGFYSHFGLDFSNGYAQEQTDHLLTELSFMHYLCFLEAGATRGVGDLRRGQRDFLTMHLGPFVDATGCAFAELTGFDFFAPIMQALHAFVAADQVSLEASEGVDEATPRAN
ncbi:MAG: molecular chaperone TorD family protein [Gammaproteobacteria bacterium]